MFPPRLKGKASFIQRISQTGSFNNLNLISDFVIFTGGATVTINGITGGYHGRHIFIRNLMSAAAAIQFTNMNANGLPGCKINTTANSTNIANVGDTMELVYDEFNRRWEQTSYQLGVTLPLSINSAHNLSMTAASLFTNGYLSAADYTTFSNKVGHDSGPSDGGVAYWTSNSNLSGHEIAFSWNDTLQQFGVGVGYASSLAKGHFKSDVAQTTTDATTMSATLTQFVLPTDYSAYSVAESGPDLPAPSSASATINYAGSGYTADNHTYSFQIIPGIDDGMSTTWCAGYTDTADATDDGSTNPLSIDLSWSVDSGSAGSPNKWVVLRNIDGGGFGHYIVVTTNSLADDNSGWTPTPFDATPAYPDFVASGQTYNYTAGIFKDTPAATRCYGPSPPTASFTDATNNGHTFKLSHSITVAGSAGDGNKIVKGGTTIYEGAAASFTEDTNGPFAAGSATLSPTTFGYLSNNVTLNIDYHYYATSVVAGNTVYAANPFDASVVDPDDGNYYYIVLNSFSPATGKIIKDAFASAKIVSTSTYYDYPGSFVDSVSVSPNSFYAPAFYTDGRNTTSNGQPDIIHRYLTTGGTGQIHESYRSATDVELGYIKATQNLFYIGSGGGAYTSMNTSNSTTDVFSSTWNIHAASASIDATTAGTLSNSGSEVAKWDLNSFKASKGMLHAYVAKTANYTLTTSDYCVNATSNSFDMTLPLASGVTGQVYILKNSGTGTITVKTTSSQTIDGQASGAITLTQYQSITVMSNSANWIIL